MITIEFLLTSFIVVLLPGTGVIYTVSTGITRGRKASVYAAFGCTLGIVPHLLATVCGLAAVMHTSALAFQALKYAGVAYLFFLAYTTCRETAAFAINADVSRANARDLIVKAFLLNILNPKLTIFFLAFMPQFIRQDIGQPVLQLFLFSVVFMVMTLAVFVIYGSIAHAFRSLVIDSISRQRVLKYGFAAAFAGLGIKLAVAEK